MAVKLPGTVRTPQSEVVISAPPAAAPAAIPPTPKTLMDILAAGLRRRVDKYIMRLASELETGTYVGTFPMWDCETYGPYRYDPDLEPPTPPTYMPNKVIAGGDTVWMVGLIWINTNEFHGLRVTDIFADRSYLARFETLNRTLVEPGPHYDLTGTFPAADAFPVDNIFTVKWETTFSDPGDTPNLYECDLTIDLTLSGLEYAAFSTWNLDPDTERFMGPHWQFERPAKFMVYHR